jgi:hypothetical protein
VSDGFLVLEPEVVDMKAAEERRDPPVDPGSIVEDPETVENMVRSTFEGAPAASSVEEGMS